MAQHEKREAISTETLRGYVKDAASAAGYPQFGTQGCDLTQPGYWVAYARQSLEEQSQNSRLPDYLFTSAQQAKKLGVIVPLEYVIYDAVTGEHLERPGMIWLRSLMAQRCIAGIVFPALDRLSREPLHQQIFELEATHYGVRLHYADAPNGDDPGSQFARNILAHAAKLVKLANHKNARGGNIGRVVKGWVPACRAAYGYRYRREGEVGTDGRLHVRKAWWEVNEIGPDGHPVSGSPAWVVKQVFNWIGQEARSLHWVANELNKAGLKTTDGARWSPGKVHLMVHRQCYTGTHAYGVNTKVANPNRPLGDITAEVKRTLSRPRPREEWVSFQVPALVSEELWAKANAVVSERGRGRGKQGKKIEALLRNRLLCPRCGKPMIVRRHSSRSELYYYCSKYYRPWSNQQCAYRRFLPGAWDDMVWDMVAALLSDDAWLKVQMSSAQSQSENVMKLVRLQEFRINQTRARIAKVREGFEGGVYDMAEARRRLVEYEKALKGAENEIERLHRETGAADLDTTDIEAAGLQLNALRQQRLDHASFSEKSEIITKLGIRVYPSEDLSSMRVTCGLNLQFENGGDGSEPTGCRKVLFGPP
ncbi:MAG: recombinase family protein [Dehalococcoidia bacterium]|nr:recombinase family protein [Dehalococcoidia bacterium]